MSEPATTFPARQRPVEFLLNLLVTLLTPMFLAATGGDLGLARFAAAETLESYRAETHSDLITIAKIIAFGLATLGSLSRAMDDDLPVSQVLRLRASANATDRAEQRNRLTLNQPRPEHPTSPSYSEPDIDEAALTAAVAKTQQRTARNLARFKSPAPASSNPASSNPASSNPAPATEASPTAPFTNRDQHYEATWAACAAAIAAETAASLPNLPHNERQSAALWVEALNDAANSFLTDGIPPRPKPGDLGHITRG